MRLPLRAVSGALLLAILGGASPAPGTKTRVDYRVRVDTTDLSSYSIELLIRGAPATFRMAMPIHPEYDERSWRHVEGLTAASPGGSPARVIREDSTVWRVESSGGEVTARYRIRVPPWEANRAAWRPFLSPRGGLTGGPYHFLYVLGAEAMASTVTVEVPAGWNVATALAPTGTAGAFKAVSVDDLVGSPILVGPLYQWRFEAGGARHLVSYWPGPGFVPFDTLAFVDGIARMAREAIALFGDGAPYDRYAFLFQDDAYGGLEHADAAALGWPSARLARNPLEHLPETTHEFFHAWNLMRIHPAEYRGVTHGVQERSPGLWFSEGLTMYYADLLLRRAGLPTPDSTPEARLARNIERYLASSGNYRISPERVSVATYGAGPEALGDYSASVHLQGEVIGAVLDRIIQAETGGHRSMDGVMRSMMEHFSGPRGFETADVQEVVAHVCECDVAGFFDGHVRGTEPIDFPRYLAPAGLHVAISWRPAVGDDGRPLADGRAYLWSPPDDSLPHLLIREPNSAWGRAGLHTGDRVLSVNGAHVVDWPAWRRMLQGLSIGDTVTVEMLTAAGPRRTAVAVTGYQRPHVEVSTGR